MAEFQLALGFLLALSSIACSQQPQAASAVRADSKPVSTSAPYDPGIFTFSRKKGTTHQHILDEKGRVLEFRRTESITLALLDVVSADARPSIEQIFSPQNLKMLFLARSNERTQDLVSRSAQVGESWAGATVARGQGPPTKELIVRELRHSV